MKTKPRLLDLFCGAGGCSWGYVQAGFDVVGVDIQPQPRYPFPFIQADALTYPLDDFDVIHASPPCQAYSRATIQHRKRGMVYPDLLGIMRERLEKNGKPWIIENVPGAPVQHGVILCGSQFGLRIRRHRHFETSHMIFAPCPCQHSEDFVTITGEEVYRQRANPAYTGTGCGVRSHLTTVYPREVGLAAMGIDWMTMKELSQAIPPAYTAWIGQQLNEVLR